ncbi:hypothetical protein PF049_09785 [Erythrobacteraceae bacterium WH01K]|nr:hypothetical protein PF049_09785 [Erythrobacteraceae bacterium WH01K]
MDDEDNLAIDRNALDRAIGGEFTACANGAWHDLRIFPRGRIGRRR